MTSLGMSPKVPGVTLVTRPVQAIVLALTLVGGQLSPAFPKHSPQAQQPAPAKSAAATPFSLGLAKYNFTHGPRAFPDLTAQYRPIKIDPTVTTNSPRIDQLIHDGKLELSLQDA